MAELVSAEENKKLPRVRASLEAIKPNPFQPRKAFPEEGLRQLADSIQKFGLLSPIVVRASDEGYELIAGERRLRALKLLGVSATDALLMDIDDRDCALLALIENIERESLNYFEEAEAYQSLILAHGFSQEALAKKIGRSQSLIANRLRLLKLSPNIQKLALTSGLSERHTRSLLRLMDADNQREAIIYAVKERLSVRQFDQYITKHFTSSPKPYGKSLKSIYRDHRIFINTVLNAVKQINEAGVPAKSRVVDCADHIEVIVSLPKIQKTA